MGKVIINELAMAHLLGDSDGAVGEEVQRRAREVVSFAKEEIESVMHRNPGWSDVVDYQMEHGVVAVIGFKDSPPEDRPPTYTYFGNKEIREGRFLERALLREFS
jgi:hypothetical protein